MLQSGYFTGKPWSRDVEKLSSRSCVFESKVHATTATRESPEEEKLRPKSELSEGAEWKTGRQWGSWATPPWRELSLRENKLVIGDRCWLCGQEMVGNYHCSVVGNYHCSWCGQKFLDDVPFEFTSCNMRNYTRWNLQLLMLYKSL